MLDPQEMDTYGIGLSTMDVLGLVKPLHLGPLFALVELQQINLFPLLQGIPEKIV